MDKNEKKHKKNPQEEANLLSVAFLGKCCFLKKKYV